MKPVRMMMILLVLGLMALLAPGVLAQDGPTFGLSQEDYNAWTQANAMSASASSAAFDFTLDLSVTGGAGAGGDMNVNLTGTGFYSANGFQLTLDGTAGQGDQTTPAQLEIRVVNNVIYFNSAMASGGEWVSVTESDLEMILSNMGGMLPVDPLTFLGGGDSSEMGGMSGMGELMSALATVDPEEYIAISRDGEVFVVDVDMASFVSSDAFMQLIQAGAQMQGGEMATAMPPAQMEQMGMMITQLFQDSSLTFAQTVTDGMVSNAILDVFFNIDPASMGQTGEAVQLALVFDINLSGYNQDYSVEAPADATPLSEMMNSMAQDAQATGS